MFADAEPIGIEAVTGSEAGIDVFRGERILAAILVRETPQGHEHRRVVAITDRSTLMSGWSDIKGGLNGQRFAMPHADIQRVDSKHESFFSVSAAFVALTGSAGSHKIEIPQLTKPLDGFYRTLCSTIPAEQRVEPPTPFVETSPDDSSGARHARAGLRFADPRSEQLLDAIAHRTATSRLSADVGAELTFRVVVAHRTAADGPARQEEAWVSAMPANDLTSVLTRALGPPLSDESKQEARWLEFPFDQRQDTLSAAATTLGIASYVGLGVGFRPSRVILNALLAKRPVSRLRFAIADRPGYSLYTIHAEDGPLEKRDSLLAHKLHLLLAQAAFSMLAVHCGQATGAR